MQSRTQAYTGPIPVATATAEEQLDTQTETQPAQSEPHAQERRPTSPAETATPDTPRENGTEVQSTEAQAGVAMTQRELNKPAAQSLTEPSDSATDTETDTSLKPGATSEPIPDENTNSECDGSGSKTKDQVVRDGRRYVPSKKAMVDPLKMDMSTVIPLSSSQLSMQCLECHIIFSDPKSKERHLKMSHPAEYEQRILRHALFACYVCERHFSNSTELMVHQKAHTEKKPFRCLICDLAFKKISELTLHKKIHYGQDGYQCTDCGKACKTMTLLKYHRRTHTGERPYICKECGKRFAMPKTLQKHELLHLEEGAEGDEGNNSDRAQEKKDDGESKNYPCSVCNTTFKSAKTRQRHMKTKHISPAAANRSLPAGLQREQGTPVITPISISQPTLLQLEASGPLQKVDANIDTEQIRRLIESLGNVQKVNQVVILGQVPPHAPPLEVQQISQRTEGVTLNPNPPQIDFMGQKKPECKTVELDSLNNHCDPMEQTIILEPITPDGQLETAPFSELGSHMVAVENPELGLHQTEQTERHEGEVSPQILQQPDISVFQTDPMEHMICQNEQDLEQTVILELTPALIPTVELEQFQTMPQNVFLPSNGLTSTESEQSPDQALDQMVTDASITNLSIPPLPVSLDLLPPQRDEPDNPACLLVPVDVPEQTPSEPKTHLKEEVSLQIHTASKALTHSTVEKPAPLETKENAVQKTSEEEPSDQERSQQRTSKQDRSEETSSENLIPERQEDQEKAGNQSETVEPSAKEEVQSQPEAKKLSQISELPLNVMSAQELVKVRKRKPARAFYFQGSLYEDFSIHAAPVKRQRTKKSHLVVKFGPQNKDKKNKKQKKPSQQHRKIQEEVLRGKTPAIHLSKKKVPSQKKEIKGKKDKKGGPAVSAATLKAPAANQEPQLQQHKEDTRKNKKQKGVGRDDVTNESDTASPVSKKKKVKIIKRDPREPKVAKVDKVKKISARKVKAKSKTSPASAVQTGQHVTEDSLLLLKGHKQPQLKVYKLDPSKASGSTVEDTPNDSQSMFGQDKDKLKHPTCMPVNYPISEGKKKGGRPNKSQKVLSLLSSKKVSLQPSESLPTKPKTSRKRKASSKVETEGVITSSHSRRALECQDCGERFSEVSALQKHKTTVHVVESPGLTYTNGNIFEGVSRLDLYHLPEQQDKAIGLMNASTGWDTEPEMGETALEERERNVSFPALIPSPSLPMPPLDVEIGAFEDKASSTEQSDNHPFSEQIKNSDSLHIQSEPSSETGDPLASDLDKHEDHSLKKTESEAQSSLEEDIKEDLLMEVDLVTVGEKSEKDNPASFEDKILQNESVGLSSDKMPEQVTEDTAEKTFTSQTVSCSTHQEEIKEEEEEVLVQKKKEGTGNVVRGATKSRGRGTGRSKRDMVSKKLSDEVTGSGSGKEQDECLVVYENHPITSDLEITEDGTNTEITEAKSVTTSVRSEEPPEKLVMSEAESNTTGVEKVMNERPYDRDKSPVVILERVLTSTPRAEADMELHLKLTKQGLDSAAEREVQVLGSQEIKVEEVISDPSQAAPPSQNRPSASMQPQHHCDVRTVMVKEECSLVLNEAQTTQGSSIRWNVEPVHVNTSSSLINSGDTTRDCHSTPEFNSNQCIFYPVKEEEREVLVGAAPTNSENLTIGSTSHVQRPEHQAKDSNLNGGSPSVADCQEKSLRHLSSDTGDTNYTDGHAETDAEWQYPPDVQDFLLQSSDEEDVGGFELSDPQLDSEAEVMAYFHKNTNDSRQADEPSENSPPSEIHSQAPREEGRTRKPIDYFSTYFSWDTWVDIASCTNKLSNMSTPVTAREVAQFVGIHIAMGTLKFPSPKLYWEDLTKVPLIADAMPLSRFLELSRMLKLAHPVKNPVGSGAQKVRQNIDSQLHNKHSSRQGETSPPSDEQRGGHTPNDLTNSETQIDPLWKVQPLLCRFKAGCQSLRRDSNYAVDQYLLPLTGKTHSKKLSLHCTKLIGFGGLLLHVDFKMGLSGKEDAVEKMVPRGSMVFLCKQELSTPAMLERLLVAGVHGAGRVGGARGQIGDEFVSSDGKLMLRRSHCGFILSTAGSGQKSMASLTDNFEKAQMSAHLNRNLVNLYSIPLTASAPTCWPQAVLWYLTDLALVNSWLLYRQDHRAASTSLSFMAFRLEVSKTFIQSSSSDTQDSVPSHSPLEKAQAARETSNPSLVEESPLPDAATRYDGSGHWPEQLGEGEGGRCRFGGCQRTTRVLCLKCCVFLCISRNHNCFLNFHNQGDLGKK
ncbi:zinc finger protein 576, tandem duplicate 1 [Halichoeres trimaculatus]|uniref:zinc finger protein 576, tandem duplicate 1 n=1 Tax=Halichoeres trimaculatus TaxID=147232 RepID=UPI003D9DFCAF